MTEIAQHDGPNQALAWMRSRPLAATGLALVAFWALLALCAPWLAPYDPTIQLIPFQGPGTQIDNHFFLLGTDHLGRDIISRLMWGARPVLMLAPLATAAAYIVGISLGLVAGYRGGWIDEILSRLGDVVLSFPIMVLYVVIVSTIGASALNIVIAVTFASAPGIMRIVRGLVLDLRNRDYVDAARIRGETNAFIMLVEILPNARTPLIVDACLRMGYVIITIGVLGFLGLGLPPPDPDWGGMVNEARPFAMAFPHMTIWPCIAISSLVFGFNLLADGLKEKVEHHG